MQPFLVSVVSYLDSISSEFLNAFRHHMLSKKKVSNIEELAIPWDPAKAEVVKKEIFMPRCL